MKRSRFARLRSMWLSMGLVGCTVWLAGCSEQAIDPEQAKTDGEAPAQTSQSEPVAKSEPVADVEPLFPFEFSLPDVDGQAVSTEALKGKVVIVDFWGTWCPPCRQEIPHFVALHQKYNSQGLEIVGLNYEHVAGDAAVQLVSKFQKENRMPYPCALVTEDVMEQVPNLRGFPTTLFLDRQGRVREKLVGYHDYDKLESIAKKLLAEGV